MKRKEILEGTVDYVNYPNKGILRVEGRKVGVKNVIPGQKVRFRVLKAGEGKATGRLLEVLEKSPLETEKELCGIFPDCGGCLYQSLPYEEQLKMKEDQLYRLLSPYFDENTLFEGIKPSPEAFAYRNKMEFSFGNTVKDGPMTLGLHKKGSTYDVLDADTCRIVHPDLRKILTCTREYAKARGFQPYNKIRHDGDMRFLLVRRAQYTGEILVCLVTTSEKAHDYRAWCEEIRALDLEGQPVGIFHATCDSFGDDVAAEHLTCLFGRDYMTDKLLGLTFKISLFSFFQTNTKGAEILYQTVRDYVGKEKNTVLYDLYCGTGTIAQLMAENAGHVYGIEIVEEAVEAARANASLNGIDNCTFIAGDVLKKLEELPERPDFIILDPPREGVVPKALAKVIAYGVPKMVYVSCKATSFVRDMETFRTFGWRIERCSLVDMFPHTQHVECVTLLSKKNVRTRDCVEIGVDAEEYYRIKDMNQGELMK